MGLSVTSSKQTALCVHFISETHYLSRLGFLHAVLGTGRPLAHFVSQKETQARHQCVGCLIHRRRGAQLLAWLPCRGRDGRRKEVEAEKERKNVCQWWVGAEQQKHALKAWCQPPLYLEILNTEYLLHLLCINHCSDNGAGYSRDSTWADDTIWNSLPEFSHSSDLCITGTFHHSWTSLSRRLRTLTQKSLQPQLQGSRQTVYKTPFHAD